jgi:hypothetical protein
VVKYLNLDRNSAFDKIPSLKRGNELSIRDKAKWAEELLGIFFPLLSLKVKNEGLLS